MTTIKETTKTKSATNISDNPAVKTAKARAQEANPDGIVLSTGIRVRLHSVSASLIDEVRARIKDPDVPIIHDEEKGRELPNPSDPTYLRQLEEAEETRNRAALDAVIMFGTELLDGLPDDNVWIDRLEFLDINVGADDATAREFAYKKYIAVGAPDLPILFTASAATEAEVQQAMRGFRGDEEGKPDPGATDS